MKAQGFTLVELLAVIVILAVLALIATPVVLSIIDDAKESAMLRSAEMYLSGVENAVMRENMNSGGNFRPNLCTISSEGNLDCEGKDGIIEVEVNGEKPKNGNILFENGKIKEVTLTYQSGTIVKDTNGNLVYSDGESGSDEEETLAPGAYYTDGTFKDWETLKSEGVVTDTEVLESAFMDDELGYSNLKSIIIPENIKIFKNNAFGGSCYLESMTIMGTLDAIEGWAMFCCEGLTTINFNGTQDEWNAINFGDNWNLGNEEITVHCTDGDIIIPANS